MIKPQEFGGTLMQVNYSCVSYSTLVLNSNGVNS